MAFAKIRKWETVPRLSCIWHLTCGSDGKEPAAMQEIWAQSLGQEDPLEKGMATHSSILAWGIPWTEEPSGLQSVGSQRIRHDWATDTLTFISTMDKGFALVFTVLAPKDYSWNNFD